MEIPGMDKNEQINALTAEGVKMDLANMYDGTVSMFETVKAKVALLQQ
jgi:hypothetical protein